MPAILYDTLAATKYFASVEVSNIGKLGRRIRGVVDDL